MSSPSTTPRGRPAPVASVAGLLDAIAEIGVDPLRGGYSRPVFSTAERDLREWFVSEAGTRGLEVETDANGILWATWNPRGAPETDMVVTGSHLDSVPGGGAFDGPLGVASALAALDHLRGRGIDPVRPISLAVFPEEEGSRYGRACLGSQLLTGALDMDAVGGLRDSDGTTFADTCRRNGLDPAHMGADPARLAAIGTFVELHVEQGRGLIDLDRPVAVGASILGHGRWRITLTCQGNHAGTTAMDDRRDPMVAAARLVVEARRIAAGEPGARATVGRIEPVPGGTNVIASRVDLWLDVRHPDDDVTARVVSAIGDAARIIAAEEGCEAGIVEESFSTAVDFDLELRNRLTATLPDAPVLETGAGHDAGILAAHLPTAMLFVRNPSGISHSPEEWVADDDTEVGARALADVLADLATRP